MPKKSKASENGAGGGKSHTSKSHTSKWSSPSAIGVILFISLAAGLVLYSLQGAHDSPAASPRSPGKKVSSRLHSGEEQKDFSDTTSAWMKRLNINPSDLEALVKLCGEYDQAWSQDREDATTDDVVNCHSAIVSRLYAISRVRVSDTIVEFAVISADRVLSLARGQRERFETAVKGFSLALGNSGKCDSQPLLLPFGEFTAKSCVRAWVKMHLALKQLGQDASPGVWAGPQRFSGGPPHLQLPGIRSQPSWKLDDIPWLAAIAEDLRGAVLGDWVKLSNHNPTEQLLIAGGRDTWKSHTLLINDAWKDQLCDICPKTCGILRPRRELSASSANLPDAAVKPLELTVNFHSLRPGGRLLPHFGSHGRLIASLGVDGHEDAELRVGNEVLKWSQDQFIVFDDAFEHEVFNHGQVPRIVFSFSFVHPDLMSS